MRASKAPRKSKRTLVQRFQKAVEAAVFEKEEEVDADNPLDDMQKGVCFGILAFIVWSFVAAALMLAFFVSYRDVIIDRARLWYMVNGTASVVKQQAASLILTPVKARDALMSAILDGLLNSPNDFAAIERTLVPLFIQQPSLYSSVLVFSSLPGALVITGAETSDGQREIMLQSNTPSCILLGLQGCIDLGVPQDAFPTFWRNIILAYGQDPVVFYPEVAYESNGESWAPTPILSEQVRAGAVKITYSPAIRHYFRRILPVTNAWSNSSGFPVIFGGEITFEVGSLFGSFLRDDRLGKSGRVYMVDSSGTLLSSERVQDVFILDIGGVRLRKLWELEGSSSWSNQIRQAFIGGPNHTILSMSYLASDGSMAFITPMDPPLDRFGVVVVSLNNAAFTDGMLLVVAYGGIGPAAVPYTLVFTLSAAWFINFCLRQSAESEATHRRMGRFLFRSSTRMVTHAAQCQCCRRREEWET